MKWNFSNEHIKTIKVQTALTHFKFGLKDYKRIPVLKWICFASLVLNFYTELTDF